MNAPSTPEKKGTSSFLMIRTLGGVGIACSLLIVSAFQITKPIIKKNKAIALEKAIYQVIPGATKKITFEALQDGSFKRTEHDVEGKPRVFVGLNDKGDLMGMAVEAEGNGFQDVIKMIYGYSPEHQTIIGMYVLESKETPGLGDKIESDEAFQANFKALDVSVDPSGEKLIHSVELVKPGKKTQPWQMDAITGATISSKATHKIIRLSSETWMPRIQKNLKDIKDQINE
jgi:electron transport complex protein RnfG